MATRPASRRTSPAAEAWSLLHELFMSQKGRFMAIAHEFDLTPIVPRENQIRFCHLLQYHGRRICAAKKPKCPLCVVNDLCPYPDKTTELKASAKRTRKGAA